MPTPHIKKGETAEEARLRFNRESREYRAKRKAEGNPVKGGPANHLRKTSCKEYASNLKRLYGMSVSEHEALFNSHGGKCAICAAPLVIRGGKKFVDQSCIDHCHTTSKVRGILCAHCNTGLGMFKDNPDLLLTAIEYLKRA